MAICFDDIDKNNAAVNKFFQNFGSGKLIEKVFLFLITTLSFKILFF